MSSTVVRLCQPPTVTIVFLLHTPAAQQQRQPQLWECPATECNSFSCRIKARAKLINRLTKNLRPAGQPGIVIQRLTCFLSCLAGQVGQQLTCSAIEVEEAPTCKVHKLLALTVEIERYLLRLHSKTRLSIPCPSRHSHFSNNTTESSKFVWEAFGLRQTQQTKGHAREHLCQIRLVRIGKHPAGLHVANFRIVHQVGHGLHLQAQFHRSSKAET